MGEYRSSAAIAWQEHLVADPWTHRLPSPYSCTRAGAPCLWRLGYRGFLGPMLLLAAMYDVQNVAEARAQRRVRGRRDRVKQQRHDRHAVCGARDGERLARGVARAQQQRREPLRVRRRLRLFRH